jgi:general secretion pathway protein D
MKFIHVFLLIFSATVLSASSAKAQGEPPEAPPMEGPSIPSTNDEVTVAQPDTEDTTALPAEEPATAMPATVMPAGVTRTVIPNMATAQRQAPKLQSFKFEGADLDTVMTMYSEWTGKIYLKNDSVTASISLKADRLTIPECINVVESILAMNNIAIVPYEKKFIKVVLANSADLTGQGGKIGIDPDTEYTGNDRLVTQIIPLRNVQIPEVQTAIQHVMHSYGKIQTLEGSNSLLITDTESNILRIRELVDFVDQASARIEPRIYEIDYAEAVDIAAKLNEIITMAQADQKTASSRTASSRTVPGVIRARTTQPRKAATPTQAAISSTEGGSRMIIQGTVKVMADERTNLILIFSQEENFDFFDNIIKVLDVEVEPATTFEVVNLEYADAVDLSGTLNDLIGGANSSRSSSSSSQGSSSNSRGTGSSSRSSSSSRTGSNTRSGSNTRVTPNAAPAGAAASIENLNRLSEDTKILADERSNSILLMGQKSDIAAIKTLIKQLDIMLEQVMIEAAIFEVTIGDELRHGIDWLYRSDDDDIISAWDGANLITNTVGNVASQSLTYFQNITGINTKVAINLAASDSNVRLLSTPVIITTDNTEARLAVGEQRPIVTSTSSFANSSGTQSSTYEYKDIGIQLTVTPRINPQRVVVMEVLQQADQVGGEVLIDNNEVPIILNREFEAQISVPDRGTIALGGLINTETRDSVTKIPILGDIPLIGRYLFSSTSREDRQTELIVLMTPYVMANLEEANTQTERLYDSIDMQDSDWPSKGWSASGLKNRAKITGLDAPLWQVPDQTDPEAANYVEPSRNQSKESVYGVEAPASAEPESPTPASTTGNKNEIQQLLNSLEN